MTFVRPINMRRSSLQAVIGLILVLLLAACPLTPAMRHATGASDVMSTQAIASLSGKVDFGPARSTQATMTEVGSGATVSLIDTTTGYTVGTTVTTPDGAFVLNFSSGFRPGTGVYYLEAVKGLSAGTNLPNRVGASVARVRTLIRFQNNQWHSISQNVLLVNPTTTAIAIAVSLRSMTDPSLNRQIPPSSVLDIMTPVGGTPTTPSPYTNPNASLMPDSLIQSAYLLVLQALAQDSDPFQVITLNATDPSFNTLASAQRILSVAALSPNTQAIGGTLDVVGSGFSATASDDVVEFTNVSGGPVAATVTAVSADLSHLTVTVPAGAVTGPVAVTVAGRKLVGPTFYLALQSGHEAVDTSGNLYVSNESFGTIARVDQQGNISTFASGLDTPRALTLRNQTIYVTCAGAFRGVVTVPLASPTSTASYGTQGTIQDPRGIAFDASNRCFVTDGANNRLYRIDATGSTPVSLSISGAALTQPKGIAFGGDGKLYVANYGSQNVLALDVSSSPVTSTVFQQGFSAPWGVAFDSSGNLYVSNNSGNSVYQWNKNSGSLAPFANIPSPGGLVADRAGYVYAIDNSANNIYRITAQGDASLAAGSISSPTGIVKVGSTFYVLSSRNNSLVKIDSTTGTLSTLARGFNSPFGLAYDNVRDCFYVSNPGNGTVVKVDRTTGGTTTVLTGTGTSYGGAYGLTYRNGILYMRSNATIFGYDVTNFGAAPVPISSVMNKNTGLSRDTSSGSNAGSFYIASLNQKILRVIGETSPGTSPGSANSTNRVVVFKDQSSDSNLVAPRDVAVDASGRVWVICPAANAGTLLSYNPDGTVFKAPVTSGISNPMGLNFDGTYLWVANHDGKTLTAYNPADGSLASTIAIADNPRNLCFYSGSMYVALDQGVGRIDSYTSAPSYSKIYTNVTNATDLEVDSTGIYVMVGGAGRKINSALTLDSPWYSNYNSPSFLWQGGGSLWITDSIRFTSSNQGNWWYRLTGPSGPGGPTLAGVDSNGIAYLDSSVVCSSNGGMVTRIKTGPPQEEWTYPAAFSSPVGCSLFFGSMAFDGLGKCYISAYYSLGYTTIDATGNRTNTSGRSSAYVCLGSWAEADGSYLYQTVNSHHRIEQVTLSNGSRTILPYGLNVAEY